jgi:membrane dipeptidase
MKRVPMFFKLSALCLLSGIGVCAAENDTAKLAERAREIHKRIIAIDSHLDIPFDYPGAARETATAFDLVKTSRGQLKSAALAVFVPQGPRTPEGYAKAREDALKKYALIKAVADENPDRAAIAYSPADVRQNAQQGKFAVVISILNAYPIADLAQIDEWYKRGVRVLGYTHAGNNQWADSSRPSRTLNDQPGEHGGLSELGKNGIARMNELGILIDVSQLTTQAFQQVLALSKAPVIATHSGLKAVVDVSRNLSDDELELLRKNGGVVQIVAFGNYLRKAPEAEAGAAPAAPATVAQFVDSLSYAVKKIGIDHVGIASDFNHGGGVAGWQNEGEAQNVTAELLRRGYSERDIAKLWGGNFLRVWAQAQKVAGPHPSK